MLTNRRVFVGNLPPNVNEDDIRQEFTSYGNVTNVEIKQKKDCFNENQANRFAFINLDIDTWSLNKCIQEFAEQEWKGRYLKVALAKESFLEQLQRERLEAQAITQKQNLKYTEKNDDSTQQIEKLPPKPSLIQEKRNKSIIKDDKSDTESSSEDSSDSETKEVKKAEKKISENNLQFEESGDDDFVIKSNKNKFLNPEKIKIPSFGPAIISQQNPDLKKKMSSHALLAEQKRKQSLLEKKEQYNKQKMLLQKSFLKIDKNPQNKIVFTENHSEINVASSEIENSSTKKKAALFDEDDDDEEHYQFDLKEQFEGKEGQRLLKLQSTFSSDKRFALDSRFLDENETPDIENSEEHVIESIEDEKKHQFEILENVLGKHIDHEKDQTKKDFTMKSMLRYDPSRPDHKKFLNKLEPKKELNMKTQFSKLNSKSDDSKIEDKEPLVSKEKFYLVPENIKETIKENCGFSLLSMFGKADRSEETIEENYVANDIPKKKNKISNPLDKESNPFHYDSSDSEEDINGDIKPKKNLENHSFGHMSSTGVWRENFFFTKNDQRLLDGIKFFTTASTLNHNDKTFSETRRELKKVVKYKILNNLRNSKQFKRKLGGHKITRKNTKS